MHVMSLLSMWLGLMLGVWSAKRFKSWNLFFFVLAVTVGWLVHVVFFDMIYIVLNDLLTKIYLAKFI